MVRLGYEYHYDTPNNSQPRLLKKYGYILLQKQTQMRKQTASLSVR